MPTWPRSRVVTLRAWLSIAVAVAAALLAVACTTANPVMTFFFEGVAQPGEDRAPKEVVKNPRRPKYKPPPPAVTIVQVPELPPAIDWREIFRALPRNDAGEVAWTKALDAKLITPKAGLAADAKDEEPTDLDVELTSSGQAEYMVIFPHKVHTQWMSCPACHTGIFEMEKGKAKMTMANLGDGQYCGACHGKVAAPELSSCPECHRAVAK